MKVRLAYKDMTACEYYRLVLPSQLMTEFDVQSNDKTSLSLDADGAVQSVTETADVVVFPRPAHHLIPQIIRKLQAQGVTVVCEIDDDIRSISNKHVGWSAFQPHLNKNFNWRLAEEACNLADRVVVTTDALAERYGKHGRVDVIPNYIPQHYIDWSQEAAERLQRIIWPGIIGSHPSDLKQIGAALRQVIEEGASFVHLGSGDASPQIGTSDYTIEGKVPLLEYYKAVGQNAIGIAPLEDSKFNDSKSWLKPLEYSALGMPWVASPSPDYRKLHDLGVGTLAKRPRQWYTGLRRLLDDPEFFALEQKRGWDVASKLTIEKNYKKWEVSWEKALDYRRSQSSKSS